MATALASAANKLEEFLNAGDMAAVLTHLSYNYRDLKKLQRKLKDMQSCCKEAEEKYNHVPSINKGLSEIRELAFKVQDTLDTDFIKFMRKRRSVFKLKLLVIPCVVDQRKRRIRNVVENIRSIILWSKYVEDLTSITLWLTR
ncbi:hypothetical protein AgCh_019149 [Apium graveolens]